MNEQVARALAAMLRDISLKAEAEQYYEDEWAVAVIDGCRQIGRIKRLPSGFDLEWLDFLACYGEKNNWKANRESFEEAVPT